MKKLALFILGASTLFLVSCGQKDAVNFNDKLVNLQKDLLKTVNTIKDSKTDSTSGNELLKKMQAAIKTKVAELSAVKAPSDGEAFKQAMMDDFNGIDKSYDLLVKISDPATTPEEKTELMSQFSVWETKIGTLDENVISEQKKFASKHNIKLEYKP
jgi:hypothetical protein